MTPPHPGHAIRRKNDMMPVGPQAYRMKKGKGIFTRKGYQPVTPAPVGSGARELPA